MTTTTVVLGAPSAEREANLIHRILDAQAAAGPSAASVLVPSVAAREALVHALLGQRPNGLFLPRIFTLESLVREAAHGFDVRPCGPGARRALLAELLAALPARSRLREARDLPGLARALDHFFRALARQKIWTADHLHAAVRTYRGAAPDAMDGDLLALYAGYRRYLPHLPPDPGASPPFGTTLEMTAWITASGSALRDTLGEPALLIVVGFDQLPPLTADLVIAASALARETLVACDTLEEDPTEASPEDARAAHRVLAACGARVRVDATDPVDPLAGLVLTLAAGRSEGLPPSPIRIEPDRGTATAYADPLREVEAIATALRVRLDAGDDPADLAVAFAGPERYLPLVREVFPGFGISFHASTGIPLVSVPPVAFALALLDAMTDGLRRTRVERLLRSRYVDTHALCALAPERMDAFARQAGITGGTGAVAAEWISPLEAFAETPGPAWTEEETAAVLEGYRCFFAALAPVVGDAPAGMTSSEFVAALRRVLDALGVARIAGEGGDDPDHAPTVARDLRALERFHARLDELASACGAAGDRPASLETWASRLRAVLTDETLEPMEETRRGVAVTSVSELRSLGAHTVFVGGLTEEAMPRAPVRELFYPPLHDPARDFLQHGDPAREDHAALAGAFARQRSVHLSWPREIGGTPVLPATLVDRVLALAALPALSLDGAPLRATDAIRGAARALVAAPADGAPRFRECLRRPLTREAARAALDGVRVEEHRRAGAPSPYTGFVNDDAFVGAVGERYRPGGAHVYSAGELEGFAQCAFRFFASRLLRLPEPEVLDETLLPIERGQILHEVLHRFLARRLASGEEPPLEASRLDAHRRELLAVTEETIARAGARRGHVFADADLAALTTGLDPRGRGRERPGVLLAFLRHEVQRVADGWRPAALEWSFGDRDAPAVQVSTAGGPIHVRGRIDRVDVRNGEAAEVLDYKSGKPPQKNESDRGARFQLSLYLTVRRAVAGDAPAWNAAYYQLKSRNPGPTARLLGTKPRGATEVDAMERRLQSRLEGVAHAIAAGSFPLTVLDDESAPCDRCPYTSMCRVERGRWRARRAALESAVSVYLPDAPDEAGGDREDA